jgi:CheY-like chemotaxis protein
VLVALPSRSTSTIDGLSAASKLRCDPRFDNTFLVSLGDLTAINQRRASDRAGFNAHMIKPIGPEVVRLLLERAQTDLSASITC